MNSIVEVSVIIPNHNRVDALPLTLDALNRQTYPADQFEVILVDQASTDGSREFVENLETLFRLRLEAQDGKYGPASARNHGVEFAKGSIVIFLDSDIIADPGLIEAHVSLHNQSDGRILSCGRVLPYAPAYQSFLEKAAQPEAGLDRNQDQDDFPFYWVFSNHLSLKRDSFEDIGAFDIGLTSFEDVEYGYRASLKKYAIKNCKGAIGYHNHPRTLAERCAQARKYNQLLPHLYRRYPEMMGVMPNLRPYEPLQLRVDGLSWSAKKVLARIYSSTPVRFGFFQASQLLEFFPISTLAAKFFYYRLIQGYGYLGYKEGKKVAP